MRVLYVAAPSPLLLLYMTKIIIKAMTLIIMYRIKYEKSQVILPVIAAVKLVAKSVPMTTTIHTHVKHARIKRMIFKS